MKVAQIMGRKGGKNGKGDAKRRSTEHYVEMGRKSGAARRAKKLRSDGERQP